MEKYELDAIIDEVKDVRGGGTWHISLYIRPDNSIHSMRSRIIQEISEAESIKSDDTRDRVQSSLGKIRDVLDQYSETPENGLAIFASPNDVRVLDNLPFECPENRYHCGKEFVTEPLRGGFDTGGTFGLIVVERGRAAIAILNSGRIESVNEKESHVMGKTKAGGQSQARFERVRRKQKHQFFKDVQETAYATFKGYDIDGVAIGGTISSAKQFNEDYTNHEWNVLGTWGVDHGDEQGLSELVEKAHATLLSVEEEQQRGLVDSFLDGLRDGSAAYGQDEVDEALTQGKVETLLLSSDLSVDEIRAYVERAKNYGGDATVIDGDYEEAIMFENVSGGYGAILRW